MFYLEVDELLELDEGELDDELTRSPLKKPFCSVFRRSLNTFRRVSILSGKK